MLEKQNKELLEKLVGDIMKVVDKGMEFLEGQEEGQRTLGIAIIGELLESFDQVDVNLILDSLNKNFRK